MTLLITLTVADIDTGPFNLYSNVDLYEYPFAELIEKSVLLAGYTSTVVPDGTTSIEVRSVNELCNNFILLTVNATTSTTTSTSTSTSTTTTTTTVLTYAVGDEALGGFIAYILEPGDPGYDANVQKGLVVATSDISGGGPWGCSGTTITGADGFAIGTGNQNTIDIMAGCPTAGIAARLCGDYSVIVGGVTYNDWFLPSENELIKILLNSTVIGGVWNSVYWSSREGTSVYAWAQGPYLGTFYDFKYYSYAARPTRYF